MATPYASFQNTGNGVATSPSQAPNLPPNTTSDEIEKIFKPFWDKATISIQDFTKSRLDQYIAEPEFGQKVFDLDKYVTTEYIADANAARNLFMSILYQQIADDLLDTRFGERIRTYMDKAFPLLIDRMVRQTGECENQCSP